METPFLSALPPRLPSPENDLAGMLGSWIDNCPSLGLSSSHCRGDLDAIGALRMGIATRLSELSDSKDDAFENGPSDVTITIDMLHEYYHYLLECEQHGMVLDSGGRGGSSPSKFLALEWESGVVTMGPFKIQTSTSLELERANIIWNLAALEARQASTQTLTTKLGWAKASESLQNAARWLVHALALLQEHAKSQQQYQNPQHADMSPTFIRFWQALLLAQAQHCIYESVTGAHIRRPGHVLASKLAVATAALYNDVELIFEKDTQLPAPVLLPWSDLAQRWAYFARAWCVQMRCKAEYHKSQEDRNKMSYGHELARLQVAHQHASICQALCDEPSISSSTTLAKLSVVVDDTMELLQNRIDMIRRENHEQHSQAIPGTHELVEIRGRNVVNAEEPLSNLLRQKVTRPIFQENVNIPFDSGSVPSIDDDNVKKMSATKSKNLSPTSSASITSPLFAEMKKPFVQIVAPRVQTYVEVFQSSMNEIISQIAKESEEKTELARQALNEKNLPHSLTAYQQEISGGGLPNDLWQRVYVIQKEDRVVKLKLDLWVLKEEAESARKTYENIKSQLDFHEETDRKFREENSEFEGPDPKDIQRIFRERLETFGTYLSTAQEGESTLFQRLEQLDIEPKYKLLQFSKSQLDHLLPAARENTVSSMIFDTRKLSALWTELSALFQERDDLLTMFRNEFESYDIVAALEARVDSKSGTDQDYLEATKSAQQPFDGLRYKLQNNFKRQQGLLNSILSLNEAFMNARERTTNSQSADLCIVMIEDAIEEINQLSTHLKEGKNFYSVVIPNMDKLKREVGDSLTKLAVDRFDYEDKVRRASQEEKDALMAKNLSSQTAAIQVPTAATSSAACRSSPSNASTSELPQANQQSVAASASSARAMRNVDDGKVAKLVAMGFDAETVVAALEKHDDNLDNAVNELLSC
ncbi:unnamed protein product [Pseudo-nitzschia multistriata]|uniref:UBA domain-containing protein n=1 Tax=Pseudo-nitzschia multistriata TaxID=183589 RepID=A0A448Z0U2_9STRA|nr:unnamed protein product [Pseudo-nitzschia multistriata]